jgi:hypothetical protein
MAPHDLVPDVLELLHSPHLHTRTIQCRYVFRQLAPAAPEWDLRFTENPVDDCVTMDLRLKDQTDPEVGLGGSKTVSWDAERMRIRIDVASGRGELKRVDLADRSHWLRWQQHGGTYLGRFSPAGQARVGELYATHLDTARLCARYRFGGADESSCAGRRALRARATAFGAGAAAWTDFWVDRERGTILRQSEYEDGIATREMRAVDVEFDAQIAPERWSFPGAPWGSARR